MNENPSNENPSTDTDPGFSLRGGQPSRPQPPPQVPEEHRQWAPSQLQAQSQEQAAPQPQAQVEPQVQVEAPPPAPRPSGTATAVAEGSGLQVRDLKVFYGPVPAVRGVNLSCPPGTVIGVIGANGAGKTSLLSGIAGLVKTQGGKVELDGRDITGWPAHRRGQAGIVYVAERRRVFPSLSVRENLTVGGWGL